MASDSGSETGEDGEMELNEEGVLRLGNFSEDETSSINGLFHWQMKDYEIFHPECNVLEILGTKEDEDGSKSQKQGTWVQKNWKNKEKIKKKRTQIKTIRMKREGHRKIIKTRVGIKSLIWDQQNKGRSGPKKTKWRIKSIRHVRKNDKRARGHIIPCEGNEGEVTKRGAAGGKHRRSTKDIRTT